MTNETALKKETIKSLNKLGIFSYAIPAGFYSKKGLPDRAMHYRGEVYYLEFKSKDGKLSPDQKKFQEQCERDHVNYAIIRSLDDMINVISPMP